MTKPLASQVVLITGTSSGFGLLTAARLAAKGHRVFATMRDLNKKTDLLTEVQKRGGKVDILELDVTDEKSIQNAIDYITKTIGRIDVLLNNAGYGIGGFFEDLTQEEIRHQLETNFFGAQNMIRAVLPVMRVQRVGTIINISSIAGCYALPGFGAYNASKWALEGFSESLYYELKPFSVRVCLIEPGTYRTKIFYENRKYAAGFNNPDSVYYPYSQYFKTQVDRLVNDDKKDPEDIAVLVEKLINASHPPFRNIPDRRSRILSLLKRFLPFSVFSGMLYRALSMDQIHLIPSSRRTK